MGKLGEGVDLVEAGTGLLDIGETYSLIVRCLSVENSPKFKEIRILDRSNHAITFISHSRLPLR